MFCSSRRYIASSREDVVPRRPAEHNRTQNIGAAVTARVPPGRRCGSERQPSETEHFYDGRRRHVDVTSGIEAHGRQPTTYSCGGDLGAEDHVACEQFVQRALRI